MVYAPLIILIVSIAVLSRSASTVIGSALKLSSYFNINQLAVGFILVAVATSLPELSVSVESSLVGEGALAAGNVFGSNIANILIVLGIGAFLYGLKVSADNLRDAGMVLLLTTLISVYIIFSSSIQGRALNSIEGLVLLLIFGAYVFYTLRRKRIPGGRPKVEVTKKQALSAFLSFCIGIVLVIVSSAFVVDSAVEIASSLGLAQSFIGATILALGTSLPELSTAIAALKKKQHGLVLGNIIGSNMANLTLVLGTASVISPIEVKLPIFIAALLFAIAANSLLFYLAAVHRSVGRCCGALFMAIYAVYIILIFGLQLTEL